MDDSIQVLNIQIDNLKSGFVLKKMQTYLQSDTLDVIEFITMETLLMSEGQEGLSHAIEQCDLVLPGDKEILKAIDLESETERKEIEIYSVWKNLVRYMERKKIKVFLLTESDEELQKISAYIRKNYRGLRIVGAGVMKEDVSEEFIVNKINAAAVDCVLAFLPSPMREIFVVDHRTWFNAKVWVGMDGNHTEQESTPTNTIRTLIMRLLFHRKVIKEKNENMEN